MRVTPQGRPPKRGGPRQVPRLPPLKHTTADEHWKNECMLSIEEWLTQYRHRKQTRTGPPLSAHSTKCSARVTPVCTVCMAREAEMH